MIVVVREDGSFVREGISPCHKKFLVVKTLVEEESRRHGLIRSTSLLR
jgi:hypothetical protein